MHEREHAEGARLGENVIRQPHVEVALALQDGAVANDVVRAVSQAEEHRHDEGEKEKRRDVVGGGEIIDARIGITQQARN